MNVQSPPNLDKLRNIVQSFGPHSFTAAQAATEYEGSAASSESTKTFDKLLQRHEVVLGIQPVTGSPGVWKAC
ncbi:MAG: hypothetical protein LBJ15_09430 [Comamonas sp.]|jgi:hypothetical protein|uniref:hypothetical protein n=1 Tax=Comamonas sp. TaxID=34028 RepID=UPI00282D0374|nr:hypothetical protein [Comamonas sp.]MDR0214209.1 hypothetical protein [Comamonas sp.]